MNNRLVYLLFFTLPSTLLLGSFGEKPPVHWGKVTPSEFRINSFKNDSTVPAIVLCDYGTIDISNRTFYTRHTRIKINTEAGLSYASVEIPYQTRDKHDDFVELKAQTLLLVDGKIIRYKLPAGRIEDIKINDRWSKKKFTFPNVKPGAIVEFYYTLASLDFENLQEWYFQRDIPTLWSEIRFQVPSPIYYLVTYRNNRQLSPSDEQDYGSKLQWLYDTRINAATRELLNSRNILYSTADNRYKVWLMNNFKKKIVMKNLPGIKSANIFDWSPGLSFHLFEVVGQLPRSFQPLLATTLDESEWRSEWELVHDRSNFTGFIGYKLKTWNEFNENLLNSDHFGMAMVRNFGRKDQLDSITGNKNDAVQKMDAIYNFVRNYFKWDGEYSMYTRYKFNDLIAGKEGSSADINLLLVSLLRKAGIQADPVLIRTSNLGMPEKMYPVRGQFNHVIAVAEIEGKQYLLDATDKTATSVMLSKADLGTSGWIVRKDNPGWIDIYLKKSEPVENDSDVPIFEL